MPSRFIELCCRSTFSFLEGASPPEHLVQEAKRLDMDALALVDRNGLYGAAAFTQQCHEAGIKPIIGAQLTLEEGDELILLCCNLTGYQKLSQLITMAYRGRAKGDSLVRYPQLTGLSGDLICLVGGKLGLLSRYVSRGEMRLAKAQLDRYGLYFRKEDLYVALTHHREEGDQQLCQGLARLAAAGGLATVATNGVCYAKQADGYLHDVLLCIKNRTTLAASHAQRPANYERYLKDGAAMESLFTGDLVPAIERSREIADRCRLSLDFSCYRFPDFPVPEGFTTDRYLAQLCFEQVPIKYAGTSVLQKVEHELALIAKLKLAGYFLVVWDIVQFAKRKNIPVQGRGSAANSIVTYLLGITQVDPIAHDLFLGRFLHEGMRDIPDIDLDFAATRREGIADREDVIQYIYQRYGEDHVAMVCTYITFQTRSAIREVGHVFGLPEGILERMGRLSGRYEKDTLFVELEKLDEFGCYLRSDAWRPFQQMVNQIVNIPRHLGVHVGGMVIASCPIAHLVPLEPARMEGRMVCQWDKDAVGDAGLVKVDILGLGMLAVLREALEFLTCPPDTARMAFDDPAVYAMMAQADTVGVFQVESRAQMQSLPRTKPRNFSELAIQVAIIRPGPLQGNMVSPYIRRKRGDEAVTYLHPTLKPVLSETLGVILFQEQVLLCAVAIAGFSPAQAEALRRAMSRKRSREAMMRLREEFLAGAKRNRIPLQHAESVFRSLEGFALYGFCKSHALSFARLSYLSAWLKLYHPAAFLAALLNNQPMGFYPIDTLVEDAKRHGVIVFPVSINASVHRCLVVGEREVRLGFQLVKGITEQSSESIEKARPFHSLRMLVQRTNLRAQLVENLIQAGACDEWGLDRRELFWQLWLLQRSGTFCEGLFAQQEMKSPPLLPSGAWDKLVGEYRMMGLSPKQHPLALMRAKLQVAGVIPANALPMIAADDQVVVAGIVVCRQRPPTAKGFAFLTLEDETGLMNIILTPQIYEAFRVLFREESFLLVQGACQKTEALINIRAEKLSTN